MALIERAVQQITNAGVVPSYLGSLSTSDTYRVNNDGKLILHFKKTGAGACTVTIITPSTVGGLAIADKTVNVPATTGDVMISDLDPAVFNGGQPYLEFTLSEITGLSFASFQQRS
jgi:hypothetical protein